MATIPASQLVNPTPSVLSAGGNALVLNMLVLTQNPRVPVGAVMSFANDGSSVANFFGASAAEVAVSDVYFNGFDTSTRKPNSILFAQYNSTAVAAWLRSGRVSALTLPQLQAISGDMTVVVDGTARTGTAVSLASATSFSSAAALIQAGLNASPATLASFTAAIAPATASVTGSISGYILTVSAVASGTLVPGTVLSGTGVTANTRITSQLTGTAGGVGTYAVDTSQTVASTAISGAYGTMTVSAVASGTLSVGQEVLGAGVTAGTVITALGTGTGLTGTYIVNTSQTVISEAMTTQPVGVVVSYDSTSGAFMIASGITGAASTIAFASGTLATALSFTQALGATDSQGADAAQPSAFMTSVTKVTQNWATFMHMFDPDGGTGNVQKLLFAAWVNSSNKRYAYVVRDTDVTPTLSNSATTSLGYIVHSTPYEGVCPVYDPTDQNLDAFIGGIAASINTDVTDGRITFAFRGQAGLQASVTDATVAQNLIDNGYNFYGAYATADQTFIELQPGQVSGSFMWMDSYINEIYLNNALQLAWMVLLQSINSLPYNYEGTALIKAAASDPIKAAVNFGAIRPGVTLSNSQVAQINAAAGLDAASAVMAQGWYLLVQDSSPQTRRARSTPPITFWYADGGSVQKIDFASILVQ